MKKGILLLLLCAVGFQQYHRIDLSKYRSDTITIEVKGEIAKPGMLKVAYDACIGDVLKKVTLLEDADISGLNQAQKLVNGTVIVVPKKQADRKVSINVGTLAELDTLPGIGPSTAQKIIDYRQLHPFQTLEDLMRVKGIKDRLFQKIKAFICL